MNLTTAQLQTLKTTINADPVMSVKPNNGDGNFDIAVLFNALATPDFWVWKSKVTRDDIVNGTSPDSTVFQWTGAGYITRSQGERDAFSAIFNSAGVVDYSKANVRSAFADIFSGAGLGADNRNHINAVGRRLATRVEKLFSTGTGSTASPAITLVTGTLSASDVETARNL